MLYLTKRTGVRLTRAVALASLLLLAGLAGAGGARPTNTPRAVPAIPSPPGGNLNGVSCSSRKGCWAVGYYYTSATRFLNGVFCASRSHCWADGWSKNSGTAHFANEVVRWNGKRWSVSKAPHGKLAGDDLVAVSCGSATSCWAVGSSATRAGGIKNESLHWNGKKWRQQSVPAASRATSSQLLGISCASSSACWAVGYWQNATDTLNQAVRWNGTAWSQG